MLLNGRKKFTMKNTNAVAALPTTVPSSGLLRVRFFEATVQWEKGTNRSPDEQPTDLKRIAKLASSNYGIKPQESEDFLYLIHVDIRNARLEWNPSRLVARIVYTFADGGAGNVFPSDLLS